MTQLLEVDRLTVQYGGVRANADITMSVQEGTLVGIIGANGAGKTTFIDAITGFAPMTHGVVSFDGTEITRERPDGRARRGLVRTFQALELFDDLTVRNNLMVAAETVPGGDAEERAAWALKTVGLAGVESTLPMDLSHGQRKLVSIARALAVRPRLLLLDEPAAGLDATESAALGQMLRGLLAEGISILMIDHDMGLVLSVCDYVVAFDFGRVIAQGPPSELRRNPAVVAAYLGVSADAANEGVSSL